MTSRDDEDAAAVLAVLAALSSGATSVSEVVDRGVWGDPAHRLGAPAAPGRIGWWTSGLPR